jgi:hypothetical protein
MMAMSWGTRNPLSAQQRSAPMASESSAITSADGLRRGLDQPLGSLVRNAILRHWQMLVPDLMAR